MPHIEQTTPDVGLWNGGLRYRENVSARQSVFTDEAGALVTAQMLSIGVPLYAGDPISKITVMVGATAAGTPVNQWAALYTPAGVLMTGSQSADGTSTAISASTPLTFTLTVPQLIQAEGIYYAAIMVKATTVPSLMSQNMGTTLLSDPVLTGQPVRGQISGSALTTTAPSTIASPTTRQRVPYVVLS